MKVRSSYIFILFISQNTGSQIQPLRQEKKKNISMEFN